MDDDNLSSPRSSESILDSKELLEKGSNPLQFSLRDDEAQIDPRGFAPLTEWKNSRNQRTRTSILFVLFEFALAEGRLTFQFPDQCSQIFKLDKFSNASFHLLFRKSIEEWRTKLKKDDVLKNRLLVQHHLELQKLTYPLPKKSGNRPKRKRGYRDKGSTRPLHQRGRTDRETITAIHYEQLVVVEKIRIYGRRPTVTYRRLPYSGKIREALELGLLERVGDFYIPTPIED